jgi:hypothetical protein
MSPRQLGEAAMALLLDLLVIARWGEVGALSRRGSALDLGSLT